MQIWNFKRGKDTLGADLPLHIFINPDRTGGGIIGTGTSSNPFNSWTDALASVVDNGTIIVAPSVSLNEIMEYSASKTISIIGDSLNRDVVIKTTVEPAPDINLTPSVILFENIYIDGYKESENANNRRINCVIKSPYTRMAYTVSGNAFKDETNIYLNSVVEVDSYNGLCANHTLYACDLYVKNNGKIFTNLYIDALCTLSRDPTNIGNLNNITFDRCYFEDKTAFLASAPVGFVPVILNEVTNPTLLNAPTLIDYSVQATASSLLNGTSLSVGGQAFRGISYNTTQTNIQALVNANPLLEIVNGNIRFKSAVAVGTVTEIGGGGEIEFIASTLLELSKPTSIGLGFNPEVEFFMRWKFNFGNSFGSWKPFRFGEVATKNTNGTTTGELTYDWNDNNKIPYAVAQGKIVLTKQ